MSIVISDPNLLAEIARTNGVVDLRDPSGNVIARMERWADGKLPPGVESPFSDEEIERRRATYTSGKPLAEILQRLRGE